MIRITISILSIFISLNLFANNNSKSSIDLKNIGIDEKFGQTVDLNLKFRDEMGQLVPLSNYVNGKKPVVLLLAYYSCPHLCNLFLNGTTSAFKNSKWNLEKDYEVVTVSIDPREEPSLAHAKKANHLKELNRAGSENGWHFLVNDQTMKENSFGNAKALANSVGFKYEFNYETNEFAHAAAMIFLTPTGKVSRYLYGIDFNDRDFSLALQEASGNKIGTLKDKLLLYCFSYDHISRSYSFYVMNILRVTGFLFAIGLGIWIFSLRKRRQNTQQTPKSDSSVDRNERRL